MGRTRTTVTEEIPESSPLEQDQEETYAEILSEIGKFDQDAIFSARVTRVPVRADGTGIRGAKEGFLFDCDQSQIAGLAEYLRDTYGGGTYRIRIKKGNELFRAHDLKVELPPTRVGLPGSNDNTLVSIVGQQNQMFERLLSRMDERESKSQVDYLDVGTKIAAIVSGVVAAVSPILTPLLNRPAEGGKLIETITAVVTLAEKLSDKSGGSGETNAFDLVKTFLENGGTEVIKNAGTQLLPRQAPPGYENAELPPPNNRPPPYQGTGGGPMGKNTVDMTDAERVAANPRPNGNTRSIESVVRHANGVQQAPGNPLGIPQPMFLRLRETMLMLCRRARKNIQAESYVDFVLDELEDFHPPLTPLLQNPNVLEILCQTFPAMEPFRVWFGTLLALCQEALGAEQTDDSEQADLRGQYSATEQSQTGDMGNDKTNVPADSRGYTES